jgi:uncharacterized protein (DUF885 family)
MDTPGTFETRDRKAFFNVTTPDPKWDAKRTDEWMKTFNNSMIPGTAIHEVYPGHFVQFLWIGNNPSKIRKLTFSGTNAEGWAHYCEQMMLDQGYGRAASATPTPAETLRAAKYRLAQSDEALLRICRLCVAIKTHCEGMSLDDATKFFQENCYYEKQPAYEEARRGTFDPQYLLYTLGKLQFLKLRADLMKQQGTEFSLEQFHDELLRHGAPPIRLLRERLLKDPKAWNQLF